jgi:LysM domain-containing protein
VVTRNAAPVAVLLAVTAAVLAVHYGLQRPSRHAPQAVTRTMPAHVRAKRTAAIRGFAVVQPGDSFSAIAERTRTSVARLERLNPGVSPTALHVGQRIRVK